MRKFTKNNNKPLSLKLLFLADLVIPTQLNLLPSLRVSNASASCSDGLVDAAALLAGGVQLFQVCLDALGNYRRVRGIQAKALPESQLMPRATLLLVTFAWHLLLIPGCGDDVVNQSRPCCGGTFALQFLQDILS